METVWKVGQKEAWLTSVDSWEWAQNMQVFVETEARHHPEDLAMD